MLSAMGVPFDTVPSEFEEYFDESRSAAEVVEELALGKAMDVAKKYPDAIVIGSDTIVVLDNKQLGKPENADVAKAMLRAYRHRAHQVITSVAVVCLSKGYKKVGSDVSSVFMDGLDEDFIEAYVATDTVYDKGGAYAIQHPLVRPHVRRIDGRIDTIIGLPTNLVSMYLMDFGIESEPLDLNDSQLFKQKEFFN
jgi:septum formation protein